MQLHILVQKYFLNWNAAKQSVAYGFENLCIRILYSLPDVVIYLFPVIVQDLKGIRRQLLVAIK